MIGRARPLGKTKERKDKLKAELGNHHCGHNRASKFAELIIPLENKDLKWSMIY